MVNAYYIMFTTHPSTPCSSVPKNIQSETSPCTSGNARTEIINCTSGCRISCTHNAFTFTT
jgi:hypothetical protein